MAKLMSKSATAFMFSADRLFAASRKVYFWTFTFKNVPADDKAAMEDWDTLHLRIRKLFPDLRGLRVCELHVSHGIHFHLLLNQRIPLRRLFRIFKGSGFSYGRNRELDFGRVSVTECNKFAAEYLTKYMTKDYKKEFPTMRRRWGSVGSFDSCGVRDVIVDSPFHHNKKKLFSDSKISFVKAVLLRHYTLLYGKIGRWPVGMRKEIVLRMRKLQ